MKKVFILIHNPNESSYQIKGVFVRYEDAEKRKEELNLPWQLFIEEHEVQ